MSDLKPCPFCGCEAKHNSKEPERINCSNASCYQSEEWREYGQHVKEWQFRPLEDALRRQLEETKVKLKIIKDEALGGDTDNIYILASDALAEIERLDKKGTLQK